MIWNWKTPFRAIRALAKVCWALLRSKPVIAETVVIDTRTAICESCPGGFYDAKEGQCRACTCFVVTKVMLNTESCPHGYWHPIR